MGKRVIARKRGAGSPTYRAKSHQFAADIKHPPFVTATGTVLRVFHDPGHTTPVIEVEFKAGPRGGRLILLATEGIGVADTIQVGPDAPPTRGNVLPVGRIPEGSLIHNLEGQPGDGGRFARSAGSAATIVSHGTRTTVELPSGAFKSVHPQCRAAMGVLAGGGRTDKPLGKAGAAFHKHAHTGKNWPKVRGVAMNPVDHPHGGGSHQHVGRPSTVSRHAWPGRKVGRLSPKAKVRKKKTKAAKDAAKGASAGAAEKSE